MLRPCNEWLMSTVDTTPLHNFQHFLTLLLPQGADILWWSDGSTMLPTGLREKPLYIVPSCSETLGQSYKHLGTFAIVMYLSLTLTWLVRQVVLFPDAFVLALFNVHFLPAGGELHIYHFYLLHLGSSCLVFFHCWTLRTLYLMYTMRSGSHSACVGHNFEKKSNSIWKIFHISTLMKLYRAGRLGYVHQFMEFMGFVFWTK